ncbi:UDP binding domain-containing protein, partial [Olivibacter domesticus]
VPEQQVYSDLDYLATRSSEENKQLLKVETEPYEACKNAHAIAVLTEWDEFKTYDWQRIYDNMLKPANIFDGRNLLDKAKLEAIGFQVNAIGS